MVVEMPKFLTRKQVIKKFPILSRSLFDKLCADGKGPAYTVIGKAHYYFKKDIKRWLNIFYVPCSVDPDNFKEAADCKLVEITPHKRSSEAPRPSAKIKAESKPSKCGRPRKSLKPSRHSNLKSQNLPKMSHCPTFPIRRENDDD